MEAPGISAVIRNRHVRHAERAWSDIDWFIRSGHARSRHQERVEEVSWETVEIDRALRAAGFDGLRAWDAAPFFKNQPLIGPGCRTVPHRSESSP